MSLKIYLSQAENQTKWKEETFQPFSINSVLHNTRTRIYLVLYCVPV